MVVPFMTIYITGHLKQTEARAGLVAAIFGAGSLAGAWAGGKLTDKFGFRDVQVLALSAGGIMFIITGFVQKFEWLCVSVFMLALVAEAVRPANSTAIAFYSKPENRTRSYSLNRFAINMGFAMGMTIGGLIASVSYQLLFWVDGITSFIAAGIIYFALNRPAARKGQAAKAHHAGIIATSPWKDKQYVRFIIACIFFTICFMQVFRSVPVYFEKELHLGERNIGLVMALNGIIVGLFEMVLVQRWEGKRHAVFYMQAGAIVLAASFLVLFVHFIPAMLIAMCCMTLATFGEILAMPFFNTFWISRSNDANRGAYAAGYTMTWSLAQIIAPYLGLSLAQYAGYNWLWAGIAVLCLGAWYCFSLLYPGEKEAAA